MSFEEYARSEHEQPYIYEISQGEKKLVYFGAYHAYDPADPMLADIKKRFEELQPNVVVVEGMEKLAQLPPEAMDRVRLASWEDAARKGGEAGFALKLAVEAGIDVVSPEPDDRAEIADLEAHGYTKEQIFAFHIYRSVAQYWRQVPDLSINEFLGPYVEMFKESVDWQDFDFSLDHVEKIGKEIWGEAANLEDVDAANARIDPVPWPGTEERQTVINNVARRSSQFRDEQLVAAIRELAKKHERVLVVFGASHAYMQQPALRNLYN